jgi:hypothetical protein
MSHESIEPRARLIAALAENMSNNDWASNIIAEAEIIIRTAKEIIKIAETRLPGER